MSRRALVVDDDSVARLVLAHRVRALGFEVVEAVDVRSARAALSGGSFEAVVCDHRLPDGTGAEVLAAVEGGGARLVLVTGQVDLDDAAEAARAGGRVTLLTKPVVGADLALRLTG